MADGVAEVKKGPGAGSFLFVFFNHAGFDRDVARDKFRGDVLVERVVCFEVGQHGLVSNCGVFDHFGEALAEFATGKGEESFWVGENEAWLVK